MDGIHDLGGMQGFGAVRTADGELSHHEAWETRAQVLGLVTGAASRSWIEGLDARAGEGGAVADLPGDVRTPAEELPVGDADVTIEPDDAEHTGTREPVNVVRLRCETARPGDAEGG